MPRKKMLHWEGFTKVRFQEDGLDSYVGQPELMPTPHRHNEIEINFLDSGSMTALLGENQVTLRSGFLQVFWAGIPHQVTGIESGTKNRWITLPLQLCAKWQLPIPFLKQIFFSKFSVESDPAQAPHDLAMLERWHHDLKSGSEERREIALIEMHARLRRLALQMKGAGQPQAMETKLRDGLFEAGSMSIFISQNYQRQIKVEDVAKAANLRPNYAMRLFRQIFGVSIMSQVTQLRIQHSKSLLRGSDAKVIEIALESGFGSLTTFYQAFQRSCHQSPRQFKNAASKKRAS